MRGVSAGHAAPTFVPRRHEGHVAGVAPQVGVEAWGGRGGRRGEKEGQDVVEMGEGGPHGLDLRPGAEGWGLSTAAVRAPSATPSHSSMCNRRQHGSVAGPQSAAQWGAPPVCTRFAPACGNSKDGLLNLDPAWALLHSPSPRPPCPTPGVPVVEGVVGAPRVAAHARTHRRVQLQGVGVGRGVLWADGRRRMAPGLPCALRCTRVCVFSPGPALSSNGPTAPHPTQQGHSSRPHPPPTPPGLFPRLPLPPPPPAGTRCPGAWAPACCPPRSPTRGGGSRPRRTAGCAAPRPWPRPPAWGPAGRRGRTAGRPPHCRTCACRGPPRRPTRHLHIGVYNKRLESTVPPPSTPDATGTAAGCLAWSRMTLPGSLGAASPSDVRLLRHAARNLVHSPPKPGTAPSKTRLPQAFPSPAGCTIYLLPSRVTRPAPPRPLPTGRHDVLRHLAVALRRPPPYGTARHAAEVGEPRVGEVAAVQVQAGVAHLGRREAGAAVVVVAAVTLAAMASK